MNNETDDIYETFKKDLQNIKIDGWNEAISIMIEKILLNIDTCEYLLSVETDLDQRLKDEGALYQLYILLKFLEGKYSEKIK